MCQTFSHFKAKGSFWHQEEHRTIADKPLLRCPANNMVWKLPERIKFRRVAWSFFQVHTSTWSRTWVNWAKILRPLFLVRNSCVSTSKEHSVLPLLWANLALKKHCVGCRSHHPQACAQQRFSFYSTVITYKQRARRNIANDERRSSIIVFRSGVFNLFIELKLRSAAHADTGYIKSVFTAT